MKGAPWENRLVYIRMSFAFVYPIDGHRIVESIPLFDHRAAFLECYVVLLFLNFMSYRLSKYSILESTAKRIDHENCLFWAFSRSIRVSTATYTRIAQHLSPTYLFCTMSFTHRNFESNGTRIDRKWSIPLDSSTVSP